MEWGRMTVDASRILVVDDEENITELLSTALRYIGYDVAVAHTGREAIDRTVSFRPDVTLLDVMLPDLDGFEVCRRLRLDGVESPVIFLTARDATEDKVNGLDLGADDYVTKPFSLEEVVARVRALLRRTRDVSSDGRLRYADLEMDDASHEVWRAGEPVNLTATEYNLLRFLLMNAGRVLSKSQILDHVWQYDFGGTGTVVETYISYLRKKVDCFEPPLIQTVRGVGYTLRLPRS